ncbi:hypothetical protein OH77DRAFT_1568731 [Trametes cingulata]|nr:hypothetical protein OH77DRAFT_1568731 [Trametes cingulata]
MGWTNSVPIFHDDVTFILQPEIPEYTRPFIDDNCGIRRFVWEHLQNVNRIVQRVKYSGGTFSGTKSILCAPEFTVVGHRCTYEGRVCKAAERLPRPRTGSEREKHGHVTVTPATSLGRTAPLYFLPVPVDPRSIPPPTSLTDLDDVSPTLVDSRRVPAISFSFSFLTLFPWLYLVLLV